MKNLAQFKAENKIRQVPENARMLVVGILVLSVAVFSILGKDNVKPIIWYWAAGMIALVMVCLILDIVASRKIKALRQS